MTHIPLESYREDDDPLRQITKSLAKVHRRVNENLKLIHIALPNGQQSYEQEEAKALFEDERDEAVVVTRLIRAIEEGLSRLADRITLLSHNGERFLHIAEIASPTQFAPARVAAERRLTDKQRFHEELAEVGVDCCRLQVLKPTLGMTERKRDPCIGSKVEGAL